MIVCMKLWGKVCGFIYGLLWPLMTKVINRETPYFFSSSSTFMFYLSWYRRSHWWFEKVDCINTYGSYSRTCKGDYVRPFQPCKDVNANLTKTNISPLTAQISRDTQETVVKRNFYHVNLYIDSTGRVSNCSNSNLKGPLGLLRSMLVQITLFFFSLSSTFSSQYWRTIAIIFMPS